MRPLVGGRTAWGRALPRLSAARAHVGEGARTLASRVPLVREGGRSWVGWSVLAVAVGGGLLYLTWSVLSMLFAAAVFAWLLNPVVTWLERRGRSRDFGVIAVGLGLSALAVGLLLVVIPRVVFQLADLTANIQPYVQRLVDSVTPWLKTAQERFGVHVPVDMQELVTVAPEWLQKISPDVRARIQEWLQTAAKGSLSFILAIVSLALLPLFTFYLLRDWPSIMATVEGLIPLRQRALVHELAVEIDQRLIGFVRGQLTVAAVLGVIYTVGLWISGIDLAVTVGMMGGALFLVPYVGTLVSGALAAILALMKFGLDWHVGAAVGTFIVGQALEGTVLTPTLVGDRVGLHPLVVMVALIVGGNLLGIGGLVLAVPITAALAVIGGRLIATWRASRTFGG